MPSTVSLIQRLKQDYSSLSFKEGSEYRWSPGEHTVYYIDHKVGYDFLLHELSHGILDHSDYHRDIELLAMERAAWDTAVTLAPVYGLTIDNDQIELTLDSYRDWLHARSMCPNCEAIGVQTKKHVYTCLACRHQWHVNEARVCGLRRTKLKS